MDRAGSHHHHEARILSGQDRLHLEAAPEDHLGDTAGHRQFFAKIARGETSGSSRSIRRLLVGELTNGPEPSTFLKRS